MKSSIIAILALLPILVNAQTFWTDFQDVSYPNEVHIRDKQLFQDNLILVNYERISCEQNLLIAYNLSGKEVWSFKGSQEFIYATDSFIYIYTFGKPNIGDIMGFDQFFVTKIDKNGNVIDSSSYPATPHKSFLSFNPKNMDIATDGSILVSYKKSILKTDIDGAKFIEY